LEVLGCFAFGGGVTCFWWVFFDELWVWYLMYDAHMLRQAGKRFGEMQCMQGGVMCKIIPP
jgi:hypothetical protein